MPREKKRGRADLFNADVYFFGLIYCEISIPVFEMYLGLRSLSLFAAMKVWQSGTVGFSHCGLLRIGRDDSVSFGCRI